MERCPDPRQRRRRQDTARGSHRARPSARHRASRRRRSRAVDTAGREGGTRADGDTASMPPAIPRSLHAARRHSSALRRRGLVAARSHRRSRSGKGRSPNVGSTRARTALSRFHPPGDDLGLPSTASSTTQSRYQTGLAASRRWQDPRPSVIVLLQQARPIAPACRIGGLTMGRNLGTEDFGHAGGRSPAPQASVRRVQRAVAR